MMVEATAAETTEKLASYVHEQIDPLRRTGEWVFIRLIPNPDVPGQIQGHVSNWIRTHSYVEERFHSADLDRIAPDFPLVIGTSGPVGKTRLPGQIFREDKEGNRQHLAGAALGSAPDPVDISKLNDMLAAEANYHAHVHYGSHLSTMMNAVGTEFMESRLPGWQEWLTATMLPGWIVPDRAG
jgi:hypothetical protein